MAAAVLFMEAASVALWHWPKTQHWLEAHAHLGGIGRLELTLELSKPAVG